MTELAVIVIVTSAAAALLTWRLVLWRERVTTFLPSGFSRWRRGRHARAIGCDMGKSCGAQGGRTMRHGACVECGQLTCGRGGYIDPTSLRRRVGPTCRTHTYHSSRKQQRLRQERRVDDWNRLTDPIDASALRLNQLPEQFPGPTRATLRAFVTSDADEAVIVGIDPARLSDSIAALALGDEVYAEQRGGQTVLRRVGRKAG